MAELKMGPTDFLLLLLLGVLWGTAFMFISLGLPSASPLMFAALRYDIAGAVILLIALARRVSLMPKGRAQWTAVVVGGVLNIAGYHGFLYIGQKETTAAIAAVIVGLNPILTTVFGRAITSDERVGYGGAIGLVLGLGGVVILASLKDGSLLDAQGVGELLVVAAIASWAIGSLVIRRTQHGMDLYAILAWQMLLGAAIMHGGARLFDEGNGFIIWDAGAILSLSYLAIVSSVIGMIIYFRLLERIGAIRANLVSYIAPVFAALAAFLVLGEPFELRAVLAFILIASGFQLVAGKRRASVGVEGVAPKA